MSVSRVYYLLKKFSLDPNIADLCSAPAEHDADCSLRHSLHTNVLLGFYGDAEWTDQTERSSASISKRCSRHRWET